MSGRAPRRQEIGVRLAAGAPPRAIVRLILSEGLVLAALGIVPGLFAAYAAGRWMDSVLFGVEPADLPRFSELPRSAQ